MTITGQLQSIEKGSVGLQQKIATIRTLVHDAVRDVHFRQMAVEQLRNVRARDWDGEIRAVQRFVQRMRFTRDPWTPDGLEVFVHPKVMLLQILGGTAFGDCDDHVLLATAMLEVIGHETRYRVGGPQPGQYQHIWIDVKHPTRGWVPVEFIKPGVPVGWDPAQLFAHTEAHAHGGATTMQGLGNTTVTVRPGPGGGVSRQVPVTRGFGQPLPSDVVRSIKQAERRAGVTATEMSNGLGWVEAAINAAVAVGGAYHSYEQNRRTEGRRKRERDWLMSQGVSQREAQRMAPDPQSVDYTPYAGQLARSGVSLYNEFSYEDPYSEQYFRESEQGFIGPRQRGGPQRDFRVQFDEGRPPPISQAESRARAFYDAGMRIPKRDFDAEFRAEQGLLHRGPANARSAFEYVPTAGKMTFQRFLETGEQLSDEQRAALVRHLRSYSERTTGLGALGEPPEDPGPYVPQTKPLAMPKGWEAVVDKFTPVTAPWDDRWYQNLKPMLAKMAKEQGAEGHVAVKMGDTFDVNKYPGGSAGFGANWGGVGMLGDQAVERWMFFFAGTHHPKLLQGINAKWLTVIKWVLGAIDAGAKAAWMRDEDARKAEWQKKHDAFVAWQRDNKKKEDEKKRADNRRKAAEEAKRRAEAAQKAADEQRRKEEAARRAADNARRAQDAADAARQRRQYEQRYGGGGSGVPGGGGSVQLPPVAPKGNTGLILGLAAAAFIFMSRKR